jgi:hypothetical protein
VHKSKKGYWYVLKPEHPNAMKSGYVKRATLVLSEKLGRPLFLGEEAHHIDRDRENDSPENLESREKKQHAALHSKEDRPHVPKKPLNPDAPTNRRYIWPDDKDFLVMSELKSLREMAKIIGCSHKAVDRRLKKIKV